MKQNSYEDSERKEALSQMEAPLPPADLAARCLSTIPVPVPARQGADKRGAASRFPFARFRFPWTTASVTAAAVTGVCAVGAVGVAVGLFPLPPGSPLHPLPAFAEVEAAMRRLHTAHWTESLTQTDPQGQTVTTRRDVWMRFDPPALSETLLPAPAQTPSSPAAPREPLTVLTDPARRVLDATKEMLYFAESPSASGGRYVRVRSWPESIVGLNNPDPVGTVRQYLLGQILVPSLGPPSAAELAALKPGQGIDYLGPSWSAKPAVLEGRRVVLFEINKNASRHFWADPKTRRLVRREVRETVMQAVRQGESFRFVPVTLRRVSANFQYDAAPPPGTFDLTPPPGVAVTDQGLPAPISWNQVPERDQKAIQAAITTSEEGWRTGDFTRFAPVWDFEYLSARSRQPQEGGRVRRRMWKIRTTNQRGRWSRWQSRVQATTGTRTRDRLTVRVASQGQWRETGDTWQGDAEYTLRRDPKNPKGWRIVDWQQQSLWNRILIKHSERTRR